MIGFSNWTKNVEYQNALTKYYLAYIKQFPSEYRPVIEKILLNLEYYDEDKIDEICYKFSFEAKESEIDGVFYTAVIDSKVHNSNTFFIQIQNQENPIFFQNLYENHMLIESHKIIICDDYSGTGDTILNAVSYVFEYYKNDLKNGNFIKKIKKRLTYKKRINKISFIIFPAICSSKTKNSIEKKMKENYKNNKFEIVDIIDRNDIVLSNILSDEEIVIFNKINDYCKIPEKLRYGYNNCGDLIAMYYGIPNDTIGLLWHDCKNVKAFFKRKQPHKWYGNYRKFSYNHDDFLFVNKMIKNLGAMRGLEIYDKKVLCYVLLGYNEERIKSNNKGIDVTKILLKIIKKGYLNNDLTKGNNFPNDKYELIKKHKLGIDDSLEGILEMNLIGLKNNSI